jgi:serine/threonine-protein phosphatase 2A regulatory subunit B'
MLSTGPRHSSGVEPKGRERSITDNRRSPDLSNEDKITLSMKLSFCTQPLSLHESESDKRERRRYVQEITSLLNNPHYIEQFINPQLAAIFHMIEASLFRPLKKLKSSKAGNETMEKAEQEQLDDPTWTVLSPVYSLITRLLETESVDHKQLKTLLSHTFIQRFVDLFNSEYPPEREALKKCMQIMYMKLSSIRKTVRKAFSDLFFRLIHEDYRFNGVSEILEINSGIISGFSVPIKEEHLLFFDQVMLPLHKVQTCQLFHQDLMRCTLLFAQKDESLGPKVIHYLDKIWPKFTSAKQIAFMEEMLQIAYTIDKKALASHIEVIFTRLSELILCLHFKVSDYALSCFEKRDMMSLLGRFKKVAYPLVVPAALKASQDHWQPTIANSLTGLLKMLEELDPALYAASIDKPVVDAQIGSGNHIERLRKEQVWEKLEKEAKKQKPSLMFIKEPYRTDHLVGDFNGVNLTNCITPEIS